jgi:hypothetical protein
LREINIALIALNDFANCAADGTDARARPAAV